MTVAAPFDFRTPAAAATDRTAQEWLQAAGRASAKLWAARWPFSLDLKFNQLEPAQPRQLLRSLPESALGFSIQSAAAADKPALLAVERPMLLALLAGSMGESPKTLPTDRDLTAIERSLLELLLPQLLEPLRVAWPGREPIAITASAPGVPRSICSLPPDEPALCATLELHGPFGMKPITLLMPIGWPASTEVAVRSAGPFDRADLERALRELPLEFAVELGRARLNLRQLGTLKPGDVLVLDQRVTEPLRAKIAGAPRFDVWPGAVGATQAVQVHATRKPAAS